jgi:fumarate hydratase, class I
MTMPVTIIREEDFVESIDKALQFISVYHPADYVRHLALALERERSPAARDAISQILVNSRMAALGHRAMCQDTGTVNAFVRVGMNVRIASTRSIEELVDAGVRRAWSDPANPLRASIVGDPLFARKNTGDNAPAIVHTSVCPGDVVTVSVMAKGGGSENKTRFAMLNPGDYIVDWVVRTVETLGAGWCPPGLMGLGVGGSAEKAMLLAKESLFEPINMTELLDRGPQTPEEELRVTLYEKINALGIGAQGLGGMTTVVDVKLRTWPTHAASKPVALIPQCAADRHLTFTLDGSGPVVLEAPNIDDWPNVVLERTSDAARPVDIDQLSREEIASWHAGDRLLVSGKLLTGRDAAHKRIAELIARGEPPPVNFAGRVIYYVGPVAAVGDEAVGPAGPTTATRMDGFTEMMLSRAGVFAMIGKAERGPETVAAIAKHKAAYLIAVGGAAVLVSKAIKSARVVAFEDLGMEAIYEFQVEDMPVTVAVDTSGNSVHSTGPARWRRSSDR